MSITTTKWKFAIAVIAIALVAPTTAVAFHVFDDVRDDKFYAGPVEWAANNNITTGKSPTIFDPEGNVTRGESVTFLKRYDDNIAQDARDDIATNAGGIATNAAGIATNAGGIATNAAGIAINSADIAALEGPHTVKMVIGAGAFSGAGGGDTFTPGCQYNTLGAGEMRAGLALPLGATITGFGGWLLGTGSDLELVRTTTVVSALGTVTTATPALDLEETTLGTAEVVQAGEFFQLEWEPDGATAADQVCGAIVTYTTAAGLVSLSVPDEDDSGVPAGQ